MVQPHGGGGVSWPCKRKGAWHGPTPTWPGGGKGAGPRLMGGWKEEEGCGLALP